MKKLLLLSLIILYGLPAGARATGADKDGNRTVTFRFVAGDDMLYVRPKEPRPENAQQLQVLFAIIDKYHSEITAGTIPVYVDGYSATKGLSFVRANRVKTELILQKALKEQNFITRNYATAYTAPDGTEHKDVVIVTLKIPAKPAPQPAPQPQPKPAPTPEPAPEPAPAAQPAPEVLAEPVAASGHAGFYLRTNLLYDALLTPTIGVEYRINDHIGVKVDGSWAHWGSSHGRVHKIWLVSPEVRWCLLDAKQFYVGLGANIGEANIYKGLASVLSSYTGYQGHIYGGGVTVGYGLPLNRCISIDFNLGLGVTHFKYDTFRVSNEVRVYQGRDISKNFWGPTQAGVSLVWRLNNK